MKRVLVTLAKVILGVIVAAIVVVDVLIVFAATWLLVMMFA